MTLVRRIGQLMNKIEELEKEIKELKGGN